MMGMSYDGAVVTGWVFHGVAPSRRTEDEPHRVVHDLINPKESQ
jgi:hypothetical protein